MHNKLLNEIERRKEKCSQNYYKGIGQVLKKERIKMKSTQEAIAIGICSNTYLSKIENNQITVNKENLYLLMERMNIDTNKISFPDEMLEDLDKAVTLFFYRDIEEYEELYHHVSKYDFGILLQIVKLGYYLLINDFENATIVHNEVFRYMTILEEHGFSIFLVFSAYYYLAVKDYKNAKFTIECITTNLYAEEQLYGLYNYAKFLAYGNLHLTTVAMDAGFTAIQIFTKNSNINRVSEFFVWKDIFSVYDGSYNVGVFNQRKLENIDSNLKNYYLIIMASKASEPLIYLKHLSVDGENYLLGLFVKGRYLLMNNQIDDFENTLQKIQNLHYLKESKIDFYSLLKSMKTKDNQAVKDNLATHCLDYAINKQNLFFINIITVSISEILAEKNRYKDALIYKNKFDEYKQLFQLSQKLTVYKKNNSSI